MKKFLSAILAFSGPGLMAVSAETIVAEIDGLRYEIDTETSIAVVKTYYMEGRKYQNFEGTDAVVPSTITYEGTTYNVVLGEQAFMNAGNLVNVTLPETITEIPDECFRSCKSLSADFELPASVERIGNRAFYEWPNPTFKFPANIKYLGGASSPFDAAISGYVFSSSALESITIPGTIENIGNYCFLYSENLSNIVIEEGVKSIGRQCFSSCSNNKEMTVVLPQSLDTICGSAFDGCKMLKSINLPDGVKFIGNRAFRSTSLTEFKIPESLTVLRALFLSGTPGFDEIKIPAAVIRINPAALSGTSIKSLIFEDSDVTLDFDLKANATYGRDPWINGAQESDATGIWLDKTGKTIENLYLGRNVNTWIPEGYEFVSYSRANEETTNPFYSLTAVKTITIGDKVTDASTLVFENYSALESLTFKSAVPPVLNPLSDAQKATVKVTVPEGSVDAYKATAGWADVANFETASIDIITSDADTNLPAVYYNLRGERVDNPTPGLYIVRQGSKVTKQIIR